MRLLRECIRLFKSPSRIFQQSNSIEQQVKVRSPIGNTKRNCFLGLDKIHESCSVKIIGKAEL